MSELEFEILTRKVTKLQETASVSDRKGREGTSFTYHLDNWMLLYSQLQHTPLKLK